MSMMKAEIRIEQDFYPLPFWRSAVLAVNVGPIPSLTALTDLIPLDGGAKDGLSWL